MAQDAGIRIEGGRQLRAALATVEGGLDDLKATHKEVADIAARASADLAPKRSGRLSASIRASGTKTAGVIRAGTKKVPYAAPIHWGWGRRHIRGTFFLSDGAKNSEGQWIAVYQDHIEDLLDKVEGA